MAKNILTGVYVGGKPGVSDSSALMRRVFSLLVSDGATYDRFIFPYVDSLLLSRDGGMFGTHSLLWDIETDAAASALEKAAGEMGLDITGAQVVSISAEHSDIIAFFAKRAKRPRGCYVFGGFAERYTGGNTAPYSLREGSRRLCSFAEQICMEKGVEGIGYYSDGYVFRKEDADEDALAGLFQRKTGCAPIIKKYR